MKIKNLFIVLSSLLVLGGLTLSSCQKNEQGGGQETTTGTVKGTVTDESGSVIADVNVAIGTLTAVTAADGTYTIEKVPQEKASVVFTKTGFADVSVGINASSFKDGVAKVDAIMEVACASISGLCVNDDAEPVEGVNVSLNGSTSMETGDDGVFNFTGLTLKDYTLTLTTSECEVEITVTKSQFTAGTDYAVDLGNINVSAQPVLPGLTFSELVAAAQPWYYNEFRGGRNGDDYPHFDWSTDFFYCYVANSHIGWLEEQNEGTTVQIVNDEEGQLNPADMDNFDSYLFGRKAITNDNKNMYLKVRTHGGLANFGVMVVDPTETPVQAVKIGDTCQWDSDSYTTGDTDFKFDLSDYVGKEIYIAIGIYRAETGDYWHQLVLRRIVFANTNPDDWGWCPGDEINIGSASNNYKVQSWLMTKEMVNSTMTQEIGNYTGISIEGGDRDNYPNAYATWRDQNHIAGYWAVMGTNKDTEPFPGEGFLIKTNGGGTDVSLDVPQAYIYAAFDIDSSNDEMDLRVRGFNTENATWFKVIAIKSDYSVVNLEASEVVPGGEYDGNYCDRINDAYKMISEGGGSDNPDAYTKLSFDLSQFDGQKVVLAIAVFKGEDNGDETKLAFHSIEFN